MTQTIRIMLPVNGPGQHVAVVSRPAGGPSLYGGDRTWLRKHTEVGAKATYFAEYWGESVAGPMNLIATPTDWPFALDEGVQIIDFNHAIITVDGERLDPLSNGNTLSTAAMAVRNTATGDAWSAAKLSMLVLPRHPIVYGTLQLKANQKVSLLPDYSVVTATIQIPNALTVIVEGQMHGCNCQMDFQIKPALALPDPAGERARAVANATVTPRSVVAVDVR